VVILLWNMESTNTNKVLDNFSNYESLTTKVKQSIEKAIILNELKPGERLKEVEIANNMGVSRGPIREAFRILEAEGLLVNQLRRGFVVAPLNLKEARQIYEVRPWLEGNVAKLAWKNRNDQFISKLKGTLDNMAACKEKNDILNYTLWDAEFHKTIYENTQNQVVIDLMRSIWKKCLRYLYITNSQREELKHALKRHENLFNAFRQKTGREVAKLAEDNLIEARELLLHFLKEAGIE